MGIMGYVVSMCCCANGDLATAKEILSLSFFIRSTKEGSVSRSQFSSSETISKLHLLKKFAALGQIHRQIFTLAYIVR